MDLMSGWHAECASAPAPTNVTGPTGPLLLPLGLVNGLVGIHGITFVAMQLR